MELNISLEMQHFIDAKIKSAQYRPAEEIVRAGLASLMQQEGIGELEDDEIAKLLPGLQKKIAEGLADANAGKMSDGEDFFDQLEQENSQLR
jgi:putative addiction module CopG family antidote